MRKLAIVLGASGLLVSAPGCRGRGPGWAQFDAAMPIPSPPLDETHEVHFTYTAPDAVTFDWRGDGTVLRYWAKDLPPRTVGARPPTPLPSSGPGPWQEATVDKLVPGLDYFYEIGHPSRPIPMTFRAPPVAGATDFVFTAVGDLGATANQPAAAGVHRGIHLVDPWFVLALGDLTYADMRDQTAVDRHFDEVMIWSQRSAYMPAWGNHEWEDPSRDDLTNYKGRFAFPHAAASPGAPAAGCCGEDWYWFDFGAIRFIVYPEPFAPSTWVDWAARAEPLFRAAEGDSNIRFVITAGHRPAYSSGHHGSDLQLRGILDGFGRRYRKYVLNLNGHSHVYERTRPEAHVVHITAGTGGGSLEHAATTCLWDDCRPPAFTAYRAIHHGFLKITVRPTELGVEAICGPPAPGEDDVRCGEGEILDETTIPAGGAPEEEPRRRPPSPLFH